MDLIEFETALRTPPEMSQNERTMAIQKIISCNGTEKQHVIVMEELAELIQQVSKHLRGKGNNLALLEEMADVVICMEMLSHMDYISKSQIEDAVAVKLQRKLHRIQEK